MATLAAVRRRLAEPAAKLLLSFEVIAAILIGLFGALLGGCDPIADIDPPAAEETPPLDDLVYAGLVLGAGLNALAANLVIVGKHARFPSMFLGKARAMLLALTRLQLHL